jgi:hypothetical protein
MCQGSDTTPVRRLLQTLFGRRLHALVRKARERNFGQRLRGSDRHFDRKSSAGIGILRLANGPDAQVHADVSADENEEEASDLR